MVANSSQSTEMSERNILRKYYTDSDYFLSPEGILKVLSAMVCIVSSALYLSAGSCQGAPGLVTSGASISIVCGVTMALLYVGVVLDLPVYAPQAWLYTDIVVSAVMGILLLVTAVLSMTICVLNGAIDYTHGPLATVNAGMVLTSAVITYVTVVRRWDAPTSADRSAPRGSVPLEQDV